MAASTADCWDDSVGHWAVMKVAHSVVVLAVPWAALTVEPQAAAKVVRSVSREVVSKASVLAAALAD